MLVPESQTDYVLKVLLPTNGSGILLVAVLDAWVDFIGADIVNSTLQAEDSRTNKQEASALYDNNSFLYCRFE